MKECCICLKNKDFLQFCKNKNSKDGLSSQCRECAKKYRELNKEKKYNSSTPEYRKQYFEKNKDDINEKRRNLYKKDIDLSREKNRQRYLDNKEVVSAYNSKWYYNNIEYNYDRNKKFRKNNKESINLRNRKRQLVLKNISNITQFQINNLLLQYDNKCHYCGIDIESGVNLHIDHKIPLSKSGSHDIANLAPSCSVCNLRKGTKTDIEFLDFLNKKDSNVY